MKLFNIFKKPDQQKQQEQTVEELVAEIRAQRMVEWQPVLSRGSVNNAPAGFDHFNLEDVMIGTERGEYSHYLFAGDNAATLVRDLQYTNRFAREANTIVPGLPDFSISNMEVVLDPFPDASKQRWLFSRLIIADLTESGKLKKYPVQALIETIDGAKGARLYYTLNGSIGKGSYYIHGKDNIHYSMDFINNVVSHIWRSTEDGKTVLYNKNGHL